jgi:hypothetical protein
MISTNSRSEMSKSKRTNKITQLEAYKRLRKTWEINPKTRVVPNRKKNRQQEKLETRRLLDES